MRSSFGPCVVTILLAACASAPGVVDATALQEAAHATEPIEPMLRTPRLLDDDGIFYVQGDDPAHPRVRYLDGQLALDTTCAIRIGNKLSRKVPPVYVNGQPLGFC